MKNKLFPSKVMSDFSGNSNHPYIEIKDDGYHYLVFENEESLESFIRKLHRVKQNQFFTFTHYPNSLKIDGMSIEQFNHLSMIDIKN